VTDLRRGFETLLELDPASPEFKQLIAKYEQRAHDYYEPTGVVRKQR